MPFPVGLVLALAVLVIWVARQLFHAFNPDAHDRSKLKRVIRESWKSHLSDCEDCTIGSSATLSHAEAVVTEAEGRLLAARKIEQGGFVEPASLVEEVERSKRAEGARRKVGEAVGALLVVAMVVGAITGGVIFLDGRGDNDSSAPTRPGGPSGDLSGDVDVNDIVYQFGIQQEYCDAAFRDWTPSLQQEIRNTFDGDDVDPFGVDDPKHPYYECLEASYPPWEHGY